MIKNDQLPDSINIESSAFKTKKKTFVSEIDPHAIRRKVQKEKYIWLGVYDELLRNKHLINLMKKCADPSLPSECAAIHLEKYRLAFHKNKSFIIQSDSVMFLKLYLITKEQFLEVIRHHYQIEVNNPEIIFTALNTVDTLYNILTDNFYNSIKCVGELDDILIYSVTTSIQCEIIPPDTDVLRNIYVGLKKSFSPYSEYLIMYYLYLVDGVKNFYTINQLKEVFFKIKSTGESNSLGSTETNMTFEHQQKILFVPNENVTNSPGRRDNETVKCSTCNASPFMGTLEKDQLNQYSYIFDLHHLPIFDDNTGEFFWSNNEANWKTARDSIFKSEEINNGRSLSLNHGSLVSLSNSFMANAGGNNANNLNTLNNLNTTPLNTINTINTGRREDSEQKWINFKNDVNSGTFIEELNNLLKEFEQI